MLQAFTATQIFTGTDWLTEHAVVCNKEHIEAVVPLAQLSADVPVHNAGEGWLAPPFIDAQVYGSGGRLFSMYPTADTLEQMQQDFAEKGTALFQPTIATNTTAVMQQSVAAVKAYQKRGGKGVHGLHLEGPWLNPAKKGAHMAAWMHPPTVAEVAALLQQAEGCITTITLAPELCSDEVLALLQKENIVVSAGHTAARFQQAITAFEKGIDRVTHLFNAMPPLHHREPGLVGAVFHHTTAMASIIPDGYHVDFAVVQLAHRLLGDRLFVITDAVTTTTEGPYQHHLAGDRYVCNGTLSGSALSMHQAFLNLVEKAGIERGEALRLCSHYPAKALRIDNRWGRLAPRYAPTLLHLSAHGKKARLLNAPGEW